jgi:hypothetical protein
LNSCIYCIYKYDKYYNFDSFGILKQHAKLFNVHVTQLIAILLEGGVSNVAGKKNHCCG